MFSATGEMTYQISFENRPIRKLETGENLSPVFLASGDAVDAHVGEYFDTELFDLS